MSSNTKKIKWYLFRLKSMNSKEILWRLRQSFNNSYELLKYCSKPESICSLKYGKHCDFNIDNLKIYTNKELQNTEYEPELIAGFLYKDHKTDWTYSFNANSYWPNIPSYKLNYKGRDDISDARINWQLNRHYQFPILAKNYFLTNDKQYLNELISLFDDWNEKNPFLFGIAWTSPMEVAIRCINWIFTYYFIFKIDNDCKILKDIENGIENMANYVDKHISKYSSANNHTVVELCCVLFTAILTNNRNLIDKIIPALTYEIKQQNYSDGVNKEQSLHYQAFFLEAIVLSAKVLKDNGYDISCWKNDVFNISKYIADCLDKYGQTIEFGDNDEGYIIRFGKETNYYKYVVNMCNRVFDFPWSLDCSSETLYLLFGQKDYAQNYNYDEISSYKDGGITLLRNNDNNLVIGIDHGPLGFGSIAAHGHADALSFQVLLDGEHFLIDPGTYIYHIKEDKRNYYRSTINHNTVCINETNQSEIQGPFLWGRKANAKLVSLKNNKKQISLVAQHDGYGDIICRKFEYENNILSICDEIGNRNGVANFSFGPKCSIKTSENNVYVILNDKTYTICFNGSIINIEEKKKTFSPNYGIECYIPSIEVFFNSKLITNIDFDGKHYE